MLWLVVWGSLPLTIFGQNMPTIAPVPSDPLELATSQIQAANTPESREAALQLLARARSHFALRSTGQAYELKVNFTVDSLGKTNYDGAWEMEDLFAPRRGHRWTATAASGYTTTGIATAGEIYGDGTASAVPLRLLEARGVLFDPLQSRAYADRGSIRTSTATFHGATVTCLLLSRSRNAANPALGRDWEETEECIDPQSGLLQVHSEVPGRYAVYDYANAPQLGGPHSASKRDDHGSGQNRVEDFSGEPAGLSAPDPPLFVPTDAMKAKGRAVAMTSATKISRIQGQGPFTSAVTIHPVCVFGMVTPIGTPGRSARVTAFRPEQSGSRGRCQENRLLSADACRSAATAAFCLRDREICFPAIARHFLVERDVRRRFEVPVILVLHFHPVPRPRGVLNQEVHADGQ